MPTTAEIVEATQHIEWELTQVPPDRDSQMAVLRAQISRLPPDLRSAVSGAILVGLRVGMTPNNGQQFSSWLPKAGVAFAAFFVISLFYLIVRPYDLPSSKHMIFDVWVAFCLAASVAFIGGDAQAKGHIPFFQNSPIQFMAVGGVAVFLVALLILSKIFP